MKAWETALNEVSDGVAVLESYKGKLGESAAILEEALKKQSALYRKLVHVSVYASLNADEMSLTPFFGHRGRIYD